MDYSRFSLKELDYQPNKTVYVKITALDLDEKPRQQLEGRITSGNVSLDGSSKMQRTCTLSMVVDNETDPIVNNAYWSLNNRFTLEIGNEYNNEIVWFKQGVYIITSFSFSQSTNSLNINISGKDKLCLLDGSVGGVFTVQTNLGDYDQADENGNIIVKKTSIKDIVTQVMKIYGLERQENIIIRDLDINGFEIWTYYGDEPVYLYKKVAKGNTQEIGFFAIDFNGNKKVYLTNNKSIKLNQIPHYYQLNSSIADSNNETTIIKTLGTNSGKKCYVAKIEKGQSCGYHEIELVYNSDLIANVGETVVSILDKLVKMLGDYEYFYDLDGKFVFQKKRTYQTQIFTPLQGDTIEPTIYDTPYEYEFEDKQLFTSINNSPNISNIKNDFSIWGKKGGNQDILIHGRFAIHRKPTRYKSYNNKLWFGNWREVLYQMALDFKTNSNKKDFYPKLIENNPEYPSGKTSYEPFYADILGFWRQLYYPIKDGKLDTSVTDPASGITEEDIDNYYLEGERKGWNKSVYEAPASLNFWIDFLDTKGELEEYSIEKIGYRPKAIVEDSITSIDYSTTPEILFKLPSDEALQYSTNTAYSNIQLTEYAETLFYRAAQGVSVINKANDLFNAHVCTALSKTITSVPIFYLQPNTRVKIEGEDYVLTKINYSLSHNSLMNFTVNKIIDTIVY